MEGLIVVLVVAAIAVGCSLTFKKYNRAWAENDSIGHEEIIVYGSLEDGKNIKLEEISDLFEQNLRHPTQKTASFVCAHSGLYPLSFDCTCYASYGQAARAKVTITFQDLQLIARPYVPIILQAYSEAKREWKLDDCRAYLCFLEQFSSAGDGAMRQFRYELSGMETVKHFYETERGFLTDFIASSGEVDDITNNNGFFRSIVSQLTDGSNQLTNSAGLAFAIRELCKKRYEEQRIPVDLICAIVFVQKVYGEAVLSLMQIDAEKISAEFNSHATAYQKKIVGDFLQACNHYTERFAQ